MPWLKSLAYSPHLNHKYFSKVIYGHLQSLVGTMNWFIFMFSLAFPHTLDTLLSWGNSSIDGAIIPSMAGGFFTHVLIEKDHLWKYTRNVLTWSSNEKKSTWFISLNVNIFLWNKIKLARLINIPIRFVILSPMVTCMNLLKSNHKNVP